MFRTLTLFVFCLIVFADASNAQRKTSGAKTKKTAAPVAKKNNSAPVAKPPKAPAAEPFERASVETMKTQCVKFETEAGAVEFEMLPESAPETVRNFLNLTAIGAFDTTNFSRVVPGFIVQGGNISTREKTTPELEKRSARTIPDEPNQVKHARGILSMARSDQPNSATTNFFVLVGEASHLNGTFAAFGRVTKGMETIDAINKMPVEGDKPVKPVRLTRATIIPCPVKTEPPSN